MSPTKVCKTCRQEKDQSEFHRRGSGTQDTCKACRNETARQDYESRGKERKPHSPVQVNTRKFPALIERIESLDKQLHAKAVTFASDNMDADDLYSEMVEAILRKCQPDDSNAYLMQCANWAGKAHVAKNSTYDHYIEALDLDTTPSDRQESSSSEKIMFTIASRESVEDDLIRRETYSQLSTVLQTLPPENQKIVVLLSIGMNQREIAAKLNVTDQALSQRLQRIRKCIQTNLEGTDISLASVLG